MRAPVLRELQFLPAAPGCSRRPHVLRLVRHSPCGATADALGRSRTATWRGSGRVSPRTPKTGVRQTAPDARRRRRRYTPGMRRLRQHRSRGCMPHDPFWPEPRHMAMPHPPLAPRVRRLAGGIDTERNGSRSMPGRAQYDSGGCRQISFILCEGSALFVLAASQSKSPLDGAQTILRISDPFALS